jgi:hypothetical protein
VKEVYRNSQLATTFNTPDFTPSWYVAPDHVGKESLTTPGIFPIEEAPRARDPRLPPDLTDRRLRSPR